jgi:hypothetical protein
MTANPTPGPAPDLSPVQELAHGVAALLDDGAWRVDRQPFGGAALARGPYRLTLAFDLHRKVEVTGQPPAGRCAWTPLRIRVRAGSTPETVAREIARRLAPTYLIRYDTAAAEAAAHQLEEERDRAARTAVMDMLTLVLPRPARAASVDETGATLRWWGGTDPSPVGTGTVSINANGTEVRLDIRYLTPDAAYRVLRELQEGADQ